MNSASWNHLVVELLRLSKLDQKWLVFCHYAEGAYFSNAISINKQRDWTFKAFTVNFQPSIPDISSDL